MAEYKNLKPMRHGEIMLVPIDEEELPTNMKITKVDQFIIGHSETGHHHVLESKNDASTPRQFIKALNPEYCEEKLDADYLTARHYHDTEGNSLPFEDYLSIPADNEA